MIVGVGTDIISQTRMGKLFAQYGNKLLDKILNHREKQNILNNNMNTQQIIKLITKKFSAVEAISKAIGTGIGRNCKFHDIYIIKNHAGKPCIEIENQTRNYIQSTIAKNFTTHISFSDENISNNIIIVCNVIIEAI